MRPTVVLAVSLLAACGSSSGDGDDSPPGVDASTPAAFDHGIARVEVQSATFAGGQGATSISAMLVDTPAPWPYQPAVSEGSCRMFRKLGALRGLPILRLPDTPMPAARLRESPEPGHVSTIEAIARALRLCEGDHVATPLETVFHVAVSRAAMTGRTLVS